MDVDYDSDGEIDLFQISVEALQRETQSKLSCMLNRPKVLLSPKDIPRDYRGLADLMGIELISLWFPDNDYVRKLLSIWVKEKSKGANLGKLQEFFGDIDRYDVLDDTHKMFIKDAIEYRRRACAIVNGLNDTPDPALTEDILTIDDVRNVKEGRPLQLYDAFLLYVSADEEFARKIIKNLEGPKYNLRLCVKDRDFVGGIQMEYCAVRDMISDRCRKLLVVLSPEFLQSQTHTYFVQLAQSMSFHQRGLSRVIPCIYKDCPLSDEFRAYHVLDHRRAQGLVDFWQKLYASIVPLNQEYDHSNVLPVSQNSVHPAITNNPPCCPKLSGPLEVNIGGNDDQFAEFKSRKSSKKSVMYKISNIWKKKKPNKAVAVATN